VQKLASAYDVKSARGDCLSVEDVAELSGYTVGTVRIYLYDDQKRKMIGDLIRADQKARNRALAIVASRR